ncbi:MAG: DNA-3-methyladenine glycosylase 2 family protein [Saprospiraceae bacterium]|nr:DNA-3-methyladenine glycosylase 2 family protein [Saprospiraceae bacterium]
MITNAQTHLSKDAKLKSLIDTIELDYHWHPNQQGDAFAYLLRSIIGQQVSIQAAAKIHQRFLGLFEQNYPDANLLIQLDETALRAVGLPLQKAGYVKNVANFFLTQQLFDTDWTALSDEDIIKYLTTIKGVGKWTVEIMLMFCLNRGNVFPIDDLGIQQTIIRLYGLNASGKALKQQLLDTAAPWQPYRTLACYYLWSWKHTW